MQKTGPRGAPRLIATMKSLTDTPDYELAVLESIYSRADRVRQRDLANIVGLSLGMINAIVKRLAQKGWLTIRKVNNRNIRYAVSPAGIEQITRRSYRYLRQTIRSVVYYREAIESFVSEVKARGNEGLLLVGSSQLDFIVEHACHKAGLELFRIAPQTRRKVFTLYAESYVPADGEGGGERRTLPRDAPRDREGFLEEVLARVLE